MPLDLATGREIATAAALFASTALAAALLILALRPLLARYALARPNARSAHTTPTPQGGGLAVVGAAAAGAALGAALVGLDGADRVRLVLAFGAALLAALTGLVDDIRPLPAVPRLALQLVAAAIVVSALPEGARVLPMLPLGLERVLLVVGGAWFVNLTNFMDGMDWMTVVETVPVTAALVVFWAWGFLSAPAGLVALALCGGLLGFAPFNAPVARLFLGDVGSLPIGLLVAFCLYDLASHGALAAAILLPLYSIADSGITLLWRLKRGDKVWEAHRQHFYQVAVARGLTVRQVLGRVLVANLVLAVLAAASLRATALGAAAILLLGAGEVALLLRALGWPDPPRSGGRRVGLKTRSGRPTRRCRPAASSRTGSARESGQARQALSDRRRLGLQAAPAHPDMMVGTATNGCFDPRSRGRGGGVMDGVETRAMRKVSLRLVPFLMVCYFIAYLDRVNVSFAGGPMKHDLNLTDAGFGGAAGIFFIAYFFFEVPSNMALNRFGARRWIARIMFTWGLVSGAQAFVVGQTSFNVVRLLLGVAEAGFFPGIIFFLTMWFPSAYRARIVGLFMFAIPISTVIGSPLSGLVLDLEGLAGLHGWQWIFVLEALPALAMALVTLFYLTDRPLDAAWLEPDERRWLQARLDAERENRESLVRLSWAKAIVDPRVIAFGFVYMGCNIPQYGLSFFLPQIIKAFGGLSNVEVGAITALPYAVGAVGMVWWSRRSDRTKERTWHTIVPLASIVIGLGLAAVAPTPAWTMAALCVAGFGFFAVLPVFWTLPTALLSGAGAASGIAAVNSIGNLGGYFGPQVFGWLRDTTKTDVAGLAFLAACAVVGAVIVLRLGHDPTLERAAPVEPASPKAG